MKTQYRKGDLLLSGFRKPQLFVVADVKYGDPSSEEEVGYLVLSPLFERYRESGDEVAYVFVEDPSVELQQISREIVSETVQQELRFIEGSFDRGAFEHLEMTLSNFME